MEWKPDILGPAFESLELHALRDGVRQTSTLIRHLPSGGGGSERGTVLFLHGWSDYFFNHELAEFFAGNGLRFYALDLHNHGRSLRADTPGGYVADLDHYDADVLAALEAIGAERPAGPLILMGHSTGGLVAALWAARHPERVDALILNSPWLEMHGSSVVRHAARSLLAPLSRVRPETILRLPERGFYWRSISSEAEGEWDLDAKYRPPLAFPVRAGWLSAVLSGQGRVARGLELPMPILVILSSASSNGPLWREDMRRSDAVLDVNTMALRALELGRSVTLERVDGALHDVFLSPATVRQEAYDRLSRWLRIL
ncbi:MULTISPECIES: alpha/beta hydrolase [Arthrobacter]|uniref:Alpha/beta hydrolase n=2 Tax=Arthrobacter TaxID=1663 RepID=A0ABU9KJB3_9MICC|nr:alpha/beta hydrolase [Arthrobacter sp. YJM1]MDP5226004.1 alpha/beta hydrolase [Arthrobacter sp. YJM1]